MLIEIIRYLVAAGVGLLLGHLLRPADRAATPAGGRDWALEEATIACNPLQVIGGSRRGPGSGGEA